MRWLCAEKDSQFLVSTDHIFMNFYCQRQMRVNIKGGTHYANDIPLVWRR